MRNPAVDLFAAALVCGSVHAAFAQAISTPADIAANGIAPNTTGTQAEPITNASPSIQSSLGPFGDPGGIRAFFGAHGITYSFTYIGEMLGNTSGGVKQGVSYEGRLDTNLDIDTGKVLGVPDGDVHAQFLQIHGRGLSGNNVQDLFIVSNIEAYPDTKLYELWYEQSLLGGKLLVRAGQLGADSEFLISQTATVFINSTFGWPASTSNDLPSSGPSYPVAAPAIRLKAQPNDHLTLLAGVFDGDPAGPYIPGVNSALYQLRDPGGVNFRLQDPPLVIGEAQYAYFQEKEASGLPGSVKLGYLHHFEAFTAYDQPIGTNVSYGGDNGVYGVLDQTVYQKPGTKDEGAGVFLRATYLPSDRNLIDLYVDGGVTYKGLLPHRSGDTIGVSFAYARVSPNVAAQDAITSVPFVRDYQAVIEGTYQASIVPGFSIQPDVQYVIHPGAQGVAIPGTRMPVNNAFVLGLRASLHY